MAHMEDVLDLYAEPYDPQRPVVCFDETSTQMLADARPPIPAAPGHPRREDYEYRREGTRNLFLACEPLAGWRHVEVTERRTKEDFAYQMRWLVDEAYPDVAVVRVVLHYFGELGGFDRHRLLTGVVLEGRVAVAVEGQGDTPLMDQALQEHQVSAGVLAGAENGLGHGAAGVVHGDEQRQLRSPVLQPGVLAAVDLHQHGAPGACAGAGTGAAGSGGCEDCRCRPWSESGAP